MKYRYNPYCSCSRCRIHGYMGPAVLITLGVLFLLAQATPYRWLTFHHTWPALLIVIGLVLFLQSSAPAEGHVPRGYVAPPGSPGYPQSAPMSGTMTHPAGPVVTPAPAPPAGNLPAYNQGGETSGNTEVHNG